jgi:predicted O-linked N-acetylglucosamine transferase (SPINDLY family)
MDPMDFRISDPWLDPPGSDLSVYSEETIYLPQTYWCYQRPIFQAPVGPLPADANGFVTFGCLNNFCKVSPEALGAWAQILARVPNARLLLHTHAGTHRDRVRRIFADATVDPSRVEFLDYLPTDDYFRAYARVDIGLDSFPFNGGTTTCDAMWMGVPVVTLAGGLAVARAGVSLLSNVGLSRLIARSVDQYVQIACDVAADLEHLRTLRAGLRPQMEASPLMNAPQFARDMEHAYRTMWRRWCGRQPARSPETAVADAAVSQ